VFRRAKNRCCHLKSPTNRRSEAIFAFFPFFFSVSSVKQRVSTKNRSAKKRQNPSKNVANLSKNVEKRSKSVNFGTGEVGVPGGVAAHDATGSGFVASLRPAPKSLLMIKTAHRISQLPGW
jgi:hypothetical protein